MESIKVTCKSSSYDCFVGRNLDDTLFELVGDKKSFIVVDSEVYSLYAERIESIFPESKMYIVKSSEKNKSETEAFNIIENMLDNDIDRRTILIALGGGVVGDLSGFVASIYMRGIDYIQVPTTLLAQVDSSVGGKTAINVNRIKNVVGTFYQPRAVVVDTSFLDTLEQDEIIGGIGEIVKTACLNEDLYKFVEENVDKLLSMDNEVIKKAVVDCITIKAKIVEQDETEKSGIRKKLNLGHTIGHALEMIPKMWAKSHGEYVLYGIYYEAEIARLMDRIDEKYYVDLKSLIIKFVKEVPPLPAIDKIMGSALKDKKNRNDNICFVLPVDFGDVDEVYLSEAELEKYLESIKES